MRRTLISVVLVAIALAGAACVADPPPPQQASPRSETPAGLAPAALPADLNGKIVRIAYDTGATETLTFAPDAKSVTAVHTDNRISADSRPSAPAAVVALESGVFLVTWSVAGGVNSQVQDYRTGEMHGTWSHRADPAAPLTIETRSGSVRLVE
ncbi:hypothetical protein HLB23_22040 [Nocardia uniformis]|uniref:Uncharacterized protein n=1 Tax=Nocardia uniformis TaxID=53432 RepID=A0A849C896_9NOCA|nr:hypothetical protein [Nocardia uniformis]NNH72505.1 hypothetical protein [Nocardia uniformis]